MATPEPNFYLFGGYKSWNEHAWSASDDRVRGGQSRSYLVCSSDSSVATFRGDLDAAAIDKGAGPAGFASQRTVDPQSWDLRGYRGLRLGVAASDGRRYTLVLKDDVPPPKRPDGRDEATVSWEFDFAPAAAGGDVSAEWHEFRPTYRGVPVQDVEPLRLDRIKSIGIMMRSFFGDQQGPFKLDLNYIAAMESDGNPQQ
ncbi:NADH:ubiquinone oxidoreductase complex I intermediate-associated protein 30 [Jackrogersella minutella]|nr:NADH:ubiquinone oxidoreductase complex I intermediate-associated protein 30 [Jackrogersella minutella]